MAVLTLTPTETVSDQWNKCTLFLGFLLLDLSRISHFVTLCDILIFCIFQGVLGFIARNNVAFCHVFRPFFSSSAPKMRTIDTNVQYRVKRHAHKSVVLIIVYTLHSKNLLGDLALGY